jgi:hypothetical protein
MNPSVSTKRFVVVFLTHGIALFMKSYRFCGGTMHGPRRPGAELLLT